jgi:hypothetical protein
VLAQYGLTARNGSRAGNAKGNLTPIKLRRKGKACKRDAEGRLDDPIAAEVTVEDTFLGIPGKNDGVSGRR